MYIQIQQLNIEIKNEKQGEKLVNELAKLLYRYDKDYGINYEYED